MLCERERKKKKKDTEFESWNGPYGTDGEELNRSTSSTGEMEEGRLN